MKTFNTILFIFIATGFFSCTKDSTNASISPNTGAGGSTAKFTISGDYLYVVDHTSLKSFDISNNFSPIFRSKIEIGINIETIFPFKDKLFIGSSSTMYIYSLSNPAEPKGIAKAVYTIRMACDPVVANDSVAYATLRATGRCGGGQSALVVYNIKNINSPQLVNTISLFEPYGLGIVSNALYVCEGNQGFKIYNTSNAYDPLFVRTVTAANTNFFDVIPYGNILIAQVNDGFILYDIGTEPLQPVFLSRILN